MKRFLSLLLAFVFVMGICASAPMTITANAASVDDLTFEMDEDGTMYQIVDCDSSATGELIIPSTYNGLPVTRIGESAFSRCFLTSIVIPKTVKSIGNSAFWDSHYLENVTIPDGLKSIGVSAFAACGSLLSITIPDSVSELGNSAFEGCSSLKAVTLGIGLKRIENGVFRECSSLTDIVIPESVTSVGTQAFSWCYKLTNVTIPESVESIGDGAFYCCSALTSISIPSKVTKLEYDVFSGCSSLVSVEIPEGVTSIGWSAFESCASLKSVTIPKSLNSIGSWAFDECTALNAVYISDIISWCNLSFDNVTANPLCYAKKLYLNNELVSQLVIPTGITCIKADAFYNCSSIESVILPNGIESIEDKAFYKCKTLVDIFIPNGVKRIGEQAFYGCESLTDVTIPNSVENIDWQAFYDCESLVKVNIPEKVSYISDKTFGYAYDSWEEKEYKVEEFIVYGVKGTAAEQYANQNGFKFVSHTHNYTETVLKQPTCTEKGEKAYVCECGYTYTGEIKALGHNYSKDFTVDKQPTYQETGSKSRHCTRCSAKTDVTAIPKLVLGVPAVTQKNTAKGITLSWSAIKDAEYYIVYRRTYNTSTKKYSSWSVIGNDVCIGTSYTDTTVKLGTTYSYAVRAENKDTSSSDTPTTNLTYNVTPTVKVAVASNGIKVSWSTAANATGYTVYSSTYNTKTKKWSGWTNRGTVKASKTSWTDKSVKSGTQYKYTIRAVNGKVLSSYNKTGAATLYLAQPTVKIANASTGVKVSWNKITGATGYKVYRAEYSNGKWSGWKSVKTITKGSTVSWTDTKAKSGVKYKYTVKAVNGKTASTYKSSSSLLYLAQPKVAVKALSNGVKVAWTQSSGATSYTIYRSEYNANTKKWSSWKSIKTAKSTSKSYTDKTAKKSVKYRYTVKAVNGKVASTYKASASVKR